MHLLINCHKNPNKPHYDNSFKNFIYFLAIKKPLIFSPLE